MSYQIELRHLRYFLAVAGELNFRRAAEKLFISQPGLSRQIKQMEEIVGTQLFIRTKRSVRLTEAGYYLQKEGEYLLNHLDRTFDHVQLIGKGVTGKINIGFLGSAMQNVVPELLVKLNSEYPGISTNLEEMSNLNQVALIEDDKLDLGFVRLNAVPRGLVMKEVFRDSFSVVLPKDHELDVDTFKNVGQLRDENFILFSRSYSPFYYDTIVNICAREGFSPGISHNSVHALTIFRLVENHLGVAIVPTTLQKGFDLDVKFIELGNSVPGAVLHAVWKRDNRNPALGSILGLL